MECLKYQYAIICITAFFIAVEIAGTIYRIHNNEMKPNQSPTKVNAIVQCYNLCSTNPHCKRFGYVSDDKLNPYMSGTCHQFDTDSLENNDENYSDKMILFEPFENYVEENCKDETSVTSTLSSNSPPPTSMMTTTTEQIQTEEVTTTTEQIQSEEVTTTMETTTAAPLTSTLSSTTSPTTSLMTTTSEQTQTEEVTTTMETTMETTTAAPPVPNICLTECAKITQMARIKTTFQFANGENMDIHCSCFDSDRLTIFRGNTSLNSFLNEEKILNGYFKDIDNHWIGKQNFSRLIKEMVFNQIKIRAYNTNHGPCSIVNISGDTDEFQVKNNCPIPNGTPFSFGTWSRCADGSWWWGCNANNTIVSVFNNNPPGKYALYLL